jgi:sugar phosphate isomerase/epimerase
VDHAQRFVFSGPGSWPLERALDWAVQHSFSLVNFNTDAEPNYPASFTPERAAAIKAQTAQHGIELGIHTSSAVNMAEKSPVVSAAVDTYLQQNFDVAQALGCRYVICHGGYHFSSDREARFKVAIERMQRAVGWAEARGIEIHFENHNREPERAEIHYLPYDVEETRRFLDAIQASSFKWAFNAGHAHLLPHGFDDFLDAFGVERIGHVRLNDTNGEWEEHMLPGQGIVDFHHVFRRLSQAGYSGPFTLDFGSPDERTVWRDVLAGWLTEAVEAR